MKHRDAKKAVAPHDSFLLVACLSRTTSDTIDKTNSVKRQSSRRTPPLAAQMLAAQQLTPPIDPPKNALPPVTLPEKSSG
jgi:hypothetical protein